MSELVLQASDDFVARIAREGDPVRAVVELVWNAIDAEAATVTVLLARDGVTDAITAVQVKDDGHGINSDQVPATFGRIGGSWKKHSQRSKNGQRRLHDRNARSGRASPHCCGGSPARAPASCGRPVGRRPTGVTAVR